MSTVMEMFGLRTPLFQAPMAGGSTTPELVAAVSNAGALGSLACAMLPPDEIVRQSIQIRAQTDKPFALNLFVLEPPQPDDAVVAAGLARLQPVRDELGMPPADLPAIWCQSCSAQLEAVLTVKPALVSFTFGIIDAATVRRLQDAGIRVMGTATNVAEALAWQEAGADLVCAQGVEAGGHRGTFIGTFEASYTGLATLLPRIVDAVRIPVVAAGGLMDGRGIAAALLMGAGAAQLGTAFLTCDESGIPSAYKQRLLQAGDTATAITRAFSGRPARALVNGFVERMRAIDAVLPPYPVQNALTTPIRAFAAKAGQMEYVSMYAGQGAGMARAMPAAELVAQLQAETAALLPQ
ncbi:MAG TPA: nitronate monooxygenase [Burkholderiaceae bacterium]